MDANTKLTTAAESYLLQNPVSDQYAAQIRHRVGQYQSYFPGVTLRTLSPDLLNMWLIHLHRNTELSPKTIKGYRDAVLAVWRWAYEERLTEAKPDRIRRVVVYRSIPRAWTHEELRALICCCERLQGVIRQTNIPRRLWWAAFVYVAYSTALRLGDVLRLEWSDIRGDRIQIVQAKTGDPVLVALLPGAQQALAKLAELPQTNKKIFPCPYNRSWLFKTFKKVVENANIRNGTTRWLRRSAASYIERDQPGGAALLLGHKTPGLAERHYIDPTIAVAEPPMPPDIEWGDAA